MLCRQLTMFQHYIVRLPCRLRNNSRRYRSYMLRPQQMMSAPHRVCMLMRPRKRLFLLRRVLEDSSRRDRPYPRRTHIPLDTASGLETLSQGRNNILRYSSHYRRL